jgi:hypothetical protein
MYDYNYLAFALFFLCEVTFFLYISLQPIQSSVLYLLVIKISHFYSAHCFSATLIGVFYTVEKHRFIHGKIFTVHFELAARFNTGLDCLCITCTVHLH